jgi:hypothetical protein
MTNKPALQKIFKGILHTEEEDKCNYENMESRTLTRHVDKQMKSKKNQALQKPKKKSRNYYIPFSYN